ncbi:MAG: hypothetical protein ACE5K7_00915 [Phycisphaerae bacterium]
MILGVGYAPHMFGSGPWYRHGLGIPRRCTAADLERRFPFNMASLNANARLWPARLTDRYLRRISQDLALMRRFGIGLVRIHTVPANPEYLPFIEAVATLARRAGLRVWLDLVGCDSPLHWGLCDEQICRLFAASLKGRIEVFQPLNEQNNRRDLARVIELFNRCATAIRQADPNAQVAFSSAGFHSDQARAILKTARLDALAVNVYLRPEQRSLRAWLDPLAEFHDRQLAPRPLYLGEFGIHCRRGQVCLDEPMLARIARSAERLASMLAATDRLAAFIPFWWQDLLVLRIQCYHQLVQLNRDLHTYGQAIHRAIFGRELSAWPRPKRRRLHFDSHSQPLAGVRWEAPPRQVGAWLRHAVQGGGPAICLQRCRDPWDVEIGRALSKSLACFSGINQPLQRGPRLQREPAIVVVGRPAATPGATIGLADRHDVLRLAGRSATWRLAAALELLRRYWQHDQDGLTPEFAD